MTLAPEELKNAALAERDQIESRVRSEQAGVSTYFDMLYFELVTNLCKTEALHGWDPYPESPAANPRAVAELQWLQGYLTRLSEGRFVPYQVRRKDDKGGGKSDIRSP